MKALSLQLQIQMRMNPLVNALKGKLENCVSAWLKNESLFFCIVFPLSVQMACLIAKAYVDLDSVISVTYLVGKL